MRLKPLLVALVVALLAIPPSSGKKPASIPEPGLHEMELPLESGKAQRYSLYVPKIRQGENAPLILALHYGGEVTPYYGMHFLKVFALPAFRPLNCIIVAPDCLGRGWADPESEKAILALLDHAIKTWPVDPARVAVTGFSMGGSGAWFMAARHPEMFSAAIPVAGRPAGEPDPSVPIYAIHSRQDDVVELEPAQQAIEKLRAQGARAELEIISGPTHYQTPRFVVPLITAARWLNHIWSGADSESWKNDDGQNNRLLQSAGRPQHRPQPDPKPE
jgi:poly(3-hydroxybutyrate) depolymerase